MGNIHLFLDNSASMEGYYRENAEYKTIVSDIAAKTDKLIKPIDIWFISDSLTKYGNSPDNFSSDIATTKMADRRSSEMHEMLRKIAQKTDSTDISMFISDCILSFPDQDIKNNPEINRNEAPNALKENIFSTFSDLRKKGFAASVYAFKSGFYGTYYDYQNHNVQLNGDSRPFFLWVIGQPDMLLKFEAQLENVSTFKPAESLHFGFLSQPVNKYSVVPQIERKGNWAPTDNGIEQITPDASGQVQICLMVNLSNLPLYAQRAEYLNSNLKVEAPGCESKVTVKTKALLDKSKLRNQSQLQDYEQNTHGILVDITSMPLNATTLHLSLPLKYDTWYTNWSTLDDRETAGRTDKTFAFTYLIEGVKEAYEIPGKNFIDLSVKLTK